MNSRNFHRQCIFDTLQGLQEGLSRYSSPSRVALIYAVTPDDPVRIDDPQNLLAGHEPKFKELYLDSDQWRQKVPPSLSFMAYGHTVAEPNLHLAGLISCGGRSRSIFYQMWFTEHHPDMCSTGPTECWLEHAAYRLSHDFANQAPLYTGISGSFLREYAAHAVRDYIVDCMNEMLGWDTPLRIYPILDAILGISRTREEGAAARGKLVFVEPGALPEVAFLARFPDNERPLLHHFKHVRKLLQAVEGSDRKLVSDGRYIVGIAAHSMPGFRLTADFRYHQGFLTLNHSPVCSFADGSFHSTTHRAKLVQVEEILLEADLEPAAGSQLFRIIATLVHAAEDERYGCTLVIDLNPTPIPIAGQALERPLDLTAEADCELAKALSRVDGALQIGADLKMHRFACLLDGLTVPGEDRARGARFNSALRFTAMHPRLLVVVVSSDRPVSVIQEGVELNAQCELPPLSGCRQEPLRLLDWISIRST